MNSTDGIAVTVTLKTEITDGKETQTNSFLADGQLFKKNDIIYLRFKEDNQQETGKVNQTVKIDDQNNVTVIRQGAISMKQHFFEGEKTEGVYHSPFGTMLMKTKTKQIRTKFDEKKSTGEIFLCYELHMQDQFAGNYNVTINFRR